MKARKKIYLFILCAINLYGRDADEVEEEEEEKESDTEVVEDSRGLGRTFQPLPHQCTPIQC